MSTSDAGAMTVKLPPGVSIGPGREGAQTTPSGQVEQGMTFPVTLPNQAVTQVFVPYSVIHDTEHVAQIIADRVNALEAIHNLGG